jgi:hypothetical protein
MEQLLLSIPKELFQFSIVPFLTIQDAVKLDTAAGKEQRELLRLQLTNASFPSSLSIHLGRNAVSWLINRCIYLNNFNFSPAVKDSEVLKLGKLFSSAHQVMITNRPDNSVNRVLQVVSRNAFLLKFLNCDKSTKIVDKYIVAILERNESLTMLNLNKCSLLTGATLAAISSNNLVYLNLSGCSGVTDAALAQFLGSKQCSETLKTLVLKGWTHLTNETLLLVPEHYKQLYNLDLGGCAGIVNHPIFMIAGNCHALRTIFLNNLPLITDPSLLWLATTLTNLRAVNIRKCNSISDFAIITVRETFENIKLL